MISLYVEREVNLMNIWVRYWLLYTVEYHNLAFINIIHVLV